MSDDQSATERKTSPRGNLSRNLGVSATQDDIFSDDRLVSLPVGSWESQSCDSASRPSSRTSLRDRRKQFDLTTPTLIDEEEAEMIILGNRTRVFGEEEDDSTSVRRTPGADMYSTGIQIADNHERTPKSITTKSAQPLDVDTASTSLRLGLSLSTHALEGLDDSKGPQLSPPNESPSPDRVDHRRSQLSSSLIAPSPLGSRLASASADAGEPSTMPRWSVRQELEIQRQESFSPNTLRLSEDLGNLLQEDGDDLSPFEIPATFGTNADPDGTVSVWSAPYVFGSGTRGRPALQQRDEGGSRASKAQIRRQRNHHGNFLSHAQQPKPRRSGREAFEFGHVGGDTMTPQMINFGGAFAPPTHVRHGAFLRPAVRSEYDQGVTRHQTHSRSIQEQHKVSYSPVFFVPAQQQSQRVSDMHASAEEFVPMSNRSSTPQWNQHQQKGPISFQSATMESNSWHGSGYRYVSPDFLYPVASQSFSDARASMTPSPHMVGWSHQQFDQNVYTGTPPVRSPTDLTHGFSRPLDSSTPTQPEQSHIRKKESMKKGRRSKKKNTKERVEASTKQFTRRRKGEVTRPASAQSHDGTTDDGGAHSASEDPSEIRRAELVESPSVRVAFKEFYRFFRAEEKTSCQRAEDFALHALKTDSLPTSIHWRVYLELADLAKRSNQFDKARTLYEKACELQPFAFQGWLDYSKLEEECGRLHRVMAILRTGLQHCRYHETLMTRAVKVQEKMGNLSMVRSLLSRLRHVGIHKVWKTVLEGALIESRAGNVETARRVLKYLMFHVPWYGPLYLEAYRLERDQQRVNEALLIVERGLRSIPRYGPLWFGALRLCEEIDASKQCHALSTTLAMIDRAMVSISKELVWKIHLEAAQMHERAATRRSSVDDPGFDVLLDPARKRLSLTVLTCPANLRWKVWLAAARMELSFGNTERARPLFIRAHRAVPQKGRSATLLECSRMEEFLGNAEVSRAILCKGRIQYGYDWKVWLESILFEMRSRQYNRAIELCSFALHIHSGTGRIWACLVQLEYYKGGDTSQAEALRKALNAVPKSGEVWCEGGRIYLNPFSRLFGVHRAKRHLHFATKFTPQYGDSFIEGIRIEIISQWLTPIFDSVWDGVKGFLPKVADGDTFDSVDAKMRDFVCEVANDLFGGKGYKIFNRRDSQGILEQLKPSQLRLTTDLSDLSRMCGNADPNYGSFWFSCRSGSSDTPRKVVEHAALRVSSDIETYASVYVLAMLRRKVVLELHGLLPPSSIALEATDTNVAKWERTSDETLKSSTPLMQILQDVENEMLRSISGNLFVAGLVELNKHESVLSMRLSARAATLFGNEALFP